MHLGARIFQFFAGEQGHSQLRTGSLTIGHGGADDQSRRETDSGSEE
jgi:hypothetical protein